MHENNMKLLLAEARRLLSQEVGLLRDMADAENVVGNRQADADETFIQEGIQDDIEGLQAEITKIDRRELVIAVVGTMKAGKSTVINAIVGTEVLPTRNRPMTALPTLIRHTPGATDPVLLIEKRGPLSSLIDRLRANPKVDQLRDDKELGEAVRVIEPGNAIKDRYAGAKQIRDCLETLNDLVRLSTKLEEEFPFEDYDEIQELPVIEVEFAPLRELEGSFGSLVLLDTPGPNESDQPKLKGMLREQLRNASAVMVVLDYTQLKSEADQDVRTEVAKIATLSKTRMHALVNKFDQKDRHGDDTEDLKPLVVELMESEDGPMVAADSVFPVSAQWAYLSSRARHEVDVHGCLPDAGSDRWVEDFGDAAFGVRWEDKVLDPGAVKDCARELWEDSRFSEPLERVIGDAHANVGVHTLQSAANKLAPCAERVEHFANARENALYRGIKELDKHITELAKDEQELATLKRCARNRFHKHLEDTLHQLSESANGAKRVAEEELAREFALGRESEEKAAEKKRQERKMTLVGWLRSYLAEPTRGNANELDPDRPVITLYERSEAKRIVDAMNRSVVDVMRKFRSDVREAVRCALSEAMKSMDGERIRLNEKLANLDSNSRMKEQGFELQLRVPGNRIAPLPAIAEDIMNQVLDEKEYTVQKRRHTKSLWGRFCSWLRTEEWGTEEPPETHHRFVIDLRKAEKAALAGVDGECRELKELARTHIEDVLGGATDDLFDDAAKMVEGIRGDLIRGKHQSQLEARTKRELARQLGVFNRRGRDIRADFNGLEEDVKEVLE